MTELIIFHKITVRVEGGNAELQADLNALWARIDTAVNSFRCTTFPLRTNNEDLRETLTRDKAFYVNFVQPQYERLDDKVRFVEENHSEKKWTIAHSVMKWKNTLDSTWIYPDERSKSVDAHDGQPKSFITQQEATQGWRWIKLSEPRGTRMTESDNPFFWKGFGG